MDGNKLILNIDKTNFIMFGTRTTIDSKNKKINRVSKTKFLGVIIDEKLSWNPHVDQLCNTVAKNIGILYKLHFPSSKYFENAIPLSSFSTFKLL